MLMQAPCRNIFNTLDVDKSGGVSMEELSEGLVNMGYLVSKVRHQTMLQAGCSQPWPDLLARAQLLPQW